MLKKWWGRQENYWEGLLWYQYLKWSRTGISLIQEKCFQSFYYLVIWIHQFLRFVLFCFALSIFLSNAFCNIFRSNFCWASASNVWLWLISYLLSNYCWQNLFTLSVSSLPTPFNDAFTVIVDEKDFFEFQLNPLDIFLKFSF